MIIAPRFKPDEEIVVGKYYLVPTVYGLVVDRTDHWPVLGPMHEDKEIIKFPYAHYHLDFRFLSNAQMKALFYSKIPHATVLHFRPEVGLDLGEVVFRRRKCKRPMPDFPQFAKELKEHPSFRNPPHCQRSTTWLPELEEIYQDHILPDSMICPHKGASLRGIPVKDDCIICPLHGLRWNIKTRKLQPVECKSE